MRNVLVLGAGRSATSLITYLLDHAQAGNWKVTVGDRDREMAARKVAAHPRGEAIFFDVSQPSLMDEQVSQADLVISLLPPALHLAVAKACLKWGRHLFTASYVSPEMKALDAEAKEKGLLFLNEIGLDPGLDHLSAMKIIDRIRAEGGTLDTFESFTGGLIAPECEQDNPWKYKFTWNPRNVVIAGQGGAVKFIQEGKYKYIPYHKVFRRTEIIDIEGYGKFEGYANRDSLKYLEVYGLQGIRTLYRGTLRRPGFCRTWDLFVQLGATDDSYVMENSENMTHREFINSFLAYNPHDSVELKLMHYLHLAQDDTALMERLQWLGLFENERIGLPNATPAQILQHILEKKWTLAPEDRDMIVMWHKFIYRMPGQTSPSLLTSSCVYIGENAEQTAMAKTVGLPLGIASRLMLEGRITLSGVRIPTEHQIYEPVLAELETLGVVFREKEEPMA